tara:strand:+ start:844 stop:1125 length:282 start_codon:yes stop_codon:yes gene_type:complete
MKEWLEANPTYDKRSLTKSTRTIGQIKTVLSEESPLTAGDIVVAMKKKWKRIPTLQQINNLLCKNKHDFQKVGKIKIKVSWGRDYSVNLWIAI